MKAEGLQRVDCTHCRPAALEQAGFFRAPQTEHPDSGRWRIHTTDPGRSVEPVTLTVR